MTTQIEKTVSATEFKAKCLELMEQVSAGKLRRVRITKRGKPFVAVSIDEAALAGQPAWDGESIFGCMKDSTFIPGGLDLDAPMFTDAELDGFLQTTIDQIEELAQRPRD